MSNKKSFWATLPGILTGIAGVITAVGGLLLILHQAGVIRPGPPAPKAVASVEVNPATASVRVGETMQLTATPKDAGGNVLAGRPLNWTNSNAAVATLSSTGLVTGAMPGTAMIAATSEGKSGTVTVLVISSPSNNSPATDKAAVVKKRITPPPLLIGNIQAEANRSTWIEISNGGDVSRVPVTLIIDLPRSDPRHYDFSIVFDITNNASSDLRIVNIFVKTVEWSPLEQIVRYIPLAGLGEVRKYFCLIDKEIRLYRSHFSREDAYVVLKPGELETIELMVNALSEGKYEFEAVVEYSTKGKTGKVSIGPFQDIRFLDRARISILPR